jgi:hypothetical protein
MADEKIWEVLVRWDALTVRAMDDCKICCMGRPAPRVRLANSLHPFTPSALSLGDPLNVRQSIPVSIFWRQICTTKKMDSPPAFIRMAEL